MLCDVALFGGLKVPDSSLDGFLTAQAREALLPGLLLGAVPALPRPVEAVLEELQGWPSLAPEWLKTSLEGSRLDVRGLVSRDTFLSIGPGLTSLYRTAAGCGGGGTLLMVGLGALNFGYSVRCAFGHSSVRALSAAAVELARGSTEVAALKEAARGTFEMLLGDGAGAPFTGTA